MSTAGDATRSGPVTATGPSRGTGVLRSDGARAALLAPALAGLVAVLTLVTLELVRSSGPLLDMAFSRGVLHAAGAALVTYTLPGPLAAALVLTAGRRRTDDVTPVVVGALLVAGARLALPLLTGGLRFAVGLLAVALAVATLVLAVAAGARRRGGPLTLRMVALGAAAGVGTQLALGTWDAVWRTDVPGWAVTVVVVAAMVALAAAARAEAMRDALRTTTTSAEDAGVPHVARLWSLGLLLSLAAMILANPAFVASQTGVSPAVAGPVTGVGLLLAAWLVGLEADPRQGWPRWMLTLDGARPWVDGAVLAALVLLLLTFDGWGLLPVVLGAQVLAAQQVALALRPSAPPSTARRSAAAAAGAGLATILPLLVYQLDYDVPLGIPNVFVIIAAAALLGGAGVHLRGSPDRRTVPRSAGLPALVGVLAVLAGSGVAVTSAVLADRASATGADSVTVVSWNLHYGVTPGGHVALEEVARTIEEQGACVVLLQEVSRGWVMGGGADMGTWLAHRLGMRMSFAPAADRQFGNAVLSCAPQRDVVVHDLPYGVGPQSRSALSATVDLTAGPQRYTTVHLQHREASTPTRLDQIDTLLVRGDLGILGGDLNAEPGWPELDRLEAAGFVSAQDELGDPAQATSPSWEPRHRIDWVLGPAWAEGDTLEVLTEEQWSDHLALVLTHRVPADGG